MTSIRQLRAGVVGDDHAFRSDTIELSVLENHEVLVEIHATGLCHTDLSVASGGQPVLVPTTG